MELAEIFTNIKKDVMATVTLSHPEKLKVCHILKQAFKDCMIKENRELDEPPVLHSQQNKAFESIFRDLFNK